ncbi:MAG: acyclic terpene utilization AtuA family protein [Candidatus Hydrogenedens sp.]|nr:acyclic terpene utilization AtuA family protein [Candidatus Hydrogenedens sp.]
MSDKVIHIGGASGFWGDSNLAAHQLIASKKLNYLVFDYLAEVTMSIMARSRAENPEEGYATDFVTVVMKNSLQAIAKQGIKVISNAGGVNPEACGRAIEQLIQDLGLDLKVATVTGDDIAALVPALREQGTKEMFTGEDMPGQFMSVNAYLGAFPIASALAKGADIVITGRCVDSAVTLGACIHEFGWTADDYDKLAGGSLAGHIIECGAQATGGLFTDWELSGRWEDIGYPIAEVSGDGSFVITKPDKTGGLVSRQTVAEQLVYEIGDPQAYILPDVVCDFSRVVIEDIDTDRARVTGARGSKPTPQLKVSATWKDGYRIGAYLTIRGIDAAGKARKVAEAVLKRTSGLLKQLGAPDFTETSVEILGAEDGYGPHARGAAPREVVLKLAAKHPVPMLLMALLRELTSSGTSMAPGISALGGNRPKPAPVVRLFSMLVDKTAVTAQVHMANESWDVPFGAGEPFDAAAITRLEIPSGTTGGETVDVPLVQVAHGRSGDKGNDSNIGIIARKPELYPVLREQLTAERVHDYFSYLMTGSVDRYDLPGISALNFVLHDSLGGGGMNSLRNDPQGKAYAQILLDMPISVPKALLD